MNNISNFVNRVEKQFSKVIGKAEYSGNALPDFLMGMVQSMGMANPTGFPSSSVKGISITQNGKKYQLTLLMFEPPISIEWSDPLPWTEIMSLIEKAVIKNQKKVSFINKIKTAKGVEFAQLALAA